MLIMSVKHPFEFSDKNRRIEENIRNKSQQKEKVVVKDPEEVKGNSASEENQKNMEEQIKSVEDEIDEFAKKSAKEAGGDDPNGVAESVSFFLKKELEKKILAEQKLQDKGDVGPSL